MSNFQEVFVAAFRAELEQLEKDRVERNSNAQYSGTRAQVREQICTNTREELEYETKKKYLLNKINSLAPLSNGVAEYIASKDAKTESKFDLDSNSATADDSLNPLGGKQV